MCKQRLHIAPPAEVERLLGPPLLRKAHARLARESLRQRTLHHHALISRLMGKVLRGVACRVQMRASQVGMFAWVLDAACQYTGCRQIELLLFLLLRLALLLLRYRRSCCLLLVFMMCRCRRRCSSRSLGVKVCMVVVVIFVLVVVRLHVELGVMLLLILRVEVVVVIDEVVLYIVDEIADAVVVEGRVDNVRGVWPAQGGLATARFGDFGDAPAAGRLQHPLHNSSLSELASSC